MSNLKPPPGPIGLIYKCCQSEYYLDNSKNAVVRMSDLKPLPGPIGLPITGSALSLGSHPAKSLFAWSKEYYGPVFGLKMGSKNVLAIQGYDAMYEAMIEKAEDFAGRAQNELYTAMRNNNGIFFKQYGRHWEHWNKFSKEGLNNIKAHIQKSFISETKHALQVFEKLAVEGKATDISEPMVLLVANSFIEVIFSKRFELDDPEFVWLIDQLYGEAEGIKLRLITFFPWLGSFPPLRGFIQDAEERRKKIIGKISKMITEHGDDQEKHDLTSVFYKENPAPDIRTLKSFAFLVEDFLFGGSATTKHEINWALLFLSRNPDKMRKLQEELDSCLKGVENPVATAIESNFEGLNYLKAIVDETKRIRPIAPLSMARETLKETSLTGYKVPEGMLVLPNIWSVHHDDKIFPEPEKFKPERFINSSGQYEPSQYVIPYGMGLRSCPGYNLADLGIRSYLLTLLYHYNVEVVTPLTNEDMDGVMQNSLTSPDAKMKLTKRL